MLIDYDPMRRLQGRLFCSAEGGGEGGGGGAGAGAGGEGAKGGGEGKAGGSGISAEAHAAALAKVSKAESDLASMKEKIATLETAAKDRKGKDEGKASDKANAKIKEANDKAAASAEAAAKALGVAKGALVKSALSGLKKAEYARLAPDVTLNEDGTGLTEDSTKALETFRKDHADLFKATKIGTTPLSGAGQGGDRKVSAEDAAILAGMRFDPKKMEGRANPLAGIHGFKADARSN